MTADYADERYIDEEDLAVEWLEQAERMYKYCEKAAEAVREADLASENVKFIRAQLESGIRKTPQEYGVVPGSRGLTESAIEAAVQLHRDYKNASLALIDARFERDVARGAVTAFEQRKAALEGLVKLHGQNYFAGPAVPQNLSEQRARRDQLAQRNIRIGGKRRRED